MSERVAVAGVSESRQEDETGAAESNSPEAAVEAPRAAPAVETAADPWDALPDAPQPEESLKWYGAKWRAMAAYEREQNEARDDRVELEVHRERAKQEREELERLRAQAERRAPRAKHPTSGAPEDRETVAQVVRETVVAMFAAVASPKPTTYTTRKGHGPAGYSEERWKALAPRIPVAVKRGRWFVVSREDFEAWERSQPPPLAASKPATSTSPTWNASSALARAGLRSSR
jgi:hypothetical protein